jgi:HlyD family secretion protein
MAKKFSKKWIFIPIILVIGGVLGYKYWKSKQSALPAGIASGNGRIEARLVDASAKDPLRVKEVLVDEGDLVQPGQVLVRLDTETIEAELAKDQADVAAAREEFASAKAAIAAANADVAKANADIAGANSDVAAANSDVAAAKSDAVAANAGVAAANAAVTQQQSEIQLAQIEADRQRRMLAENATSKALFDARQTAVETTKATLQSLQAQADAAQAKAGTAQAQVGTAQAKVSTAQAKVSTAQAGLGTAQARVVAAQARADAAQQQIAAALAEVEKTKSRINDATLVSPVTGRVLYRLVEPGEVLGPGGKALTIVDLKDVYMEIFLPSDQAAALKIGAPARITVDYEPGASAAAYVSFVSPEAQFTPKQVETKSEREKLMFRVKIQIPSELVTHYIENIKTGVRGVGYVKVNPDATWPQWLEKGLLNPRVEKGLLNPPTTPSAPGSSPSSRT